MADFPIDVTIKEGKVTSDIERLRRSLDGVATSADKLRDSINKNMDSASASTKQFQSVTNNASTATLGLIRNLKQLAGAYLSLQSIQKIISLSSDFQTGLTGVIKTTGLAGSELDRFTERIKAVAREVPVSTAELLELAQTAGQVGVSGAENLEKFSVTVAKLGRASDLSGEAAVKSLARILNVTGESVSEIDRLASVIVSLGNNSAASESEIARMTTEVARATSVFGVTSAQASAFGAAMASIGVQAELGGSTVGRVMQEIANVVTAGGKSLDDFSKSLNVNSQELKRLFEDDRIAGFELVLEGIASKGTAAGLALEEVGLGGAQVAKTIVPLANNIGLLRNALELANAEAENATALNREFEATLDGLSSQWKISKNILEGYGRAIGDVLLPPLTKLLSLFNSLNQEAANDPISQQVKKVTDLQERLKTLQTRRDFLGPLAFLGPNKKEFDLLEQQIEESINDLARLGPTFETVAKSAGKTETAVGNTNDEVDNTGKVSKKAKTEAESFAEALIKEANEAGKTRFEVLRLNAARLGQADSLEPYIRVLEEQARIEREVSEQQRQHENDLRKVEQLTSSVRTKQEVYNDELAELNRLLDSGKLSYDTYNKSLQKIEDELHKTENTGRDVFDRLNQFGIQAARNIQTSFADFFFDPFEQGLGGLVSSFGRAIRRMLAEAAALKTIELTGIGSIFAPSGTSGRSGFSLNTGNLLSVASSGFGIANLFRAGGSGLSSLVASGASGLGRITGLGALSSFGAGASGAASAGVFGAGGANFLGGAGTALGAGSEFGAAASLGSTFASVAGPAIALLAVDQIGKFLANGRTTGTFADKIPVIGGLAGALFGRKPFKFDREDLVGTITAGGFEGVFNDSHKAKGSAFRGSRRDNIIVDTDTGALLNQYGRLSESGISGQLSQYIDPAIERALELGGILDESITTTAESLRSVAKTLDISTESLDNFSLSVDLVSEKGKQLDDAQIAQVIADAAEQMATGLIPEIGNLANRGESAVQTIVRLGAQFDVLTNAASVVLGKSGADARSLVKSFGLADQSAFVQAAGGIENLAQGVEQFFNNLDDSDKLPILEDRLRGILKTVGVDFIPTMDQFNTAMMSGKLSAEQYVAALNPVTQTLIKQIDDLTKKEPELAKPREVSVKVAEKAARAERQKAEAEKYQAEMEAIKAVKAEAESMRDTFLHAGDASGAVMNELKIIGESLQFTTADAFNAGLARQIADASQIVANRASASALRIPNIDQFMSGLLQNITSDSVVKPIYMSIRNAIVDGSGDMSNAVRDSVNGFAQTIAREQARISRAPRATGIAAVMSAESDLSFARASGFVGGQIQFGRDVIAYGQAIEKLNRRLNGGQITADEYAGALSEIDRVMGANAKLLGDTEAQLRRINEASLSLAFAGLDSIGFYFGDIAKQTAELNKKSSESGAAISKTTEAIGRINSVSTVFFRSAAAVSDGISGAGSLAKSLQGSQAVGKAGQALLIAEAASIATQVLTTADAAQAAKKLAQDSAFENVSSAGLRDISLLLDGLNAFDATSFENAFLRINNALISGSVTQEQYNVLFNTALDTFEGLNDSAGGAKSALGQLRDAAKSAADQLLLDQGLTTLNSQQSLTEAQRQFDALIGRAKGGDADASNELSGAANNLLRIGKGSVDTQGEYNVLFGRTINDLRSIENIVPGLRSQRLDTQPIVDELKELRAEVKLLREQNNLGNKNVARSTSKTLRQLDNWNANGMPATAT